MTHEYKHKVDLDEMESMECDCHYSHRRGLSVIAKCNMCGKEHGFDEDGLFAYARELEARNKELEKCITDLERQLANERWKPSLKITHTGNEKIYGIVKMGGKSSPTLNEGDER